MSTKPSPDRYGNTRRKHITLTHDGWKQIETYANAHDMTFSAAIEAMALIGMGADISSLLVPLINNSVEKGLTRHFNRLAKLALLAAAESAMANGLSTMLLLQTLRKEAHQHPQDFESRIPVSHDSASQLDRRIRQLYNQMRGAVKDRQKRLLKRPLEELLRKMATEASEGEVTDAEA